MESVPMFIADLFTGQVIVLLILFIVALWQTYHRGFVSGLRSGTDATLGILAYEQVISLEHTDAGDLYIRPGKEGKSKKL